MEKAFSHGFHWNTATHSGRCTVLQKKHNSSLESLNRRATTSSGSTLNNSQEEVVLASVSPPCCGRCCFSSLAREARTRLLKRPLVPPHTNMRQWKGRYISNTSFVFNRDTVEAFSVLFTLLLRYEAALALGI